MIGRPIVFEFDDNNNEKIEEFMKDFKEDDASIKRNYSDGQESLFNIKNQDKIIKDLKWKNSGWRIVIQTAIFGVIIAVILSSPVWIPMLISNLDPKSSNKKKDNKKKSKNT